MTRTFTVTAFLLLLATTNAAEKKSKPTEADYFPLRVGDSWTYRATNGDTQHSLNVMSEEKQADGTTRYLVETLAGVKVHTLYSKVSGWVLMHSEIYPEHEGLQAKYEPPRKYLQNPLIPGSKWEWKGKDYTFTEVEEKYEVKGFEKVTVLAGKFRAMKVVSHVAGGVARMTKTYWYADGVGLVKSMTDSGQIKYGWELVAYSFKKDKKK
jgi:hypothetical protein